MDLRSHPPDGGDGTYLNLGAFISAIIYFII
jgi:hypothetical protein